MYVTMIYLALVAFLPFRSAVLGSYSDNPVASRSTPSRWRPSAAWRGVTFWLAWRQSLLIRELSRHRDLVRHVPDRGLPGAFPAGRAGRVLSVQQSADRSCQHEVMHRLNRVVARAGVVVALGLASTVTVAAPAVSAPVTPAATPAKASVFTPVPPVRLVDTRKGLGPSTPGDNGTITVQVAGQAGIPADATAVVLNVTATETDGARLRHRLPGRPAAPAGLQSQPRAGQAEPAEPRDGADRHQRPGLHLHAHEGRHPGRRLRLLPPGHVGSAGRYVPVGPVRAYDSRSARGPLAAGETVHVPLRNYIDPTPRCRAERHGHRGHDDGYYTVFAAGDGPPATRPTSTSSRAARCRTRSSCRSAPTAVDIYSFAGGHVDRRRVRVVHRQLGAGVERRALRAR